MAQSNSNGARKNPGMMVVLSFIAVSLVNAIVLFAANAAFPSQVVLGTISLSPAWAIALTSATISLLTILFLPFLTSWEIQRGKDLQPMEMIGVYFVFNAGALWLVTRASDVFGTGVRSWVVVVVVAAVLDILQGMVMMQLEKIRPRFTSA